MRPRKGKDEHGDHAGQSNDAHLVHWQKGPDAPNPHDVLRLRPRACPHGPRWQRKGEACEDDFKVLPTPLEEHRLGTNQLEGRVPLRKVCNIRTQIAFEATSDT